MQQNSVITAKWTSIRIATFISFTCIVLYYQVWEEPRIRQFLTMEMITLHHHRLLLLLIAIIPICSSEFLFAPIPNYATLREARRQAFSGTPGGWKSIDLDGPFGNKAKQAVAIAEKKAKVTSTVIWEAFRKVCLSNCRIVANVLVLLYWHNHSGCLFLSAESTRNSDNVFRTKHIDNWWHI